ncbi:MAG: divalent-cation tolerance protein CutA [Polyangiales bacterium]
MRVVLCSVPPSDADRIARALVERRLVACVSVVPAVTSTYRWKGAVEQSSESLLILKTTQAHLATLLIELPKLHPYEVPEIVALPVARDDVHPAYLAWVEAETRGE